MNLRSLTVLFLIAAGAARAADADLDAGWQDPPVTARLRAYWWWLNGNVTTSSITRDLEEMRAKGFGGALICDADGSAQDGNARAKHGPTFMSPEWRALYRHTLREADRLGLEMSLNIQSGWNLGGPMIAAAEAPKLLVWAETNLPAGPAGGHPLPLPAHKKELYRDVAVIALPAPPDPEPAPLKDAPYKTLARTLHMSAPDCRPLVRDEPPQPGDPWGRTADVVDLTDRLAPDGTLRWTAPAGRWRVIRFGYTLNDHCRVSTCSEGWDGYALDPLDHRAFDRYWNAVVEPLIADAGPLAGRTLRYLHTDSWEVENVNWTDGFREEFRRRRGYDLLPFLPALLGRVIDSRDRSNRFLNDFRRTIADLAIDHHYVPFREGAHRHGLQIHPESGGPHAVPIDAQQCLGMDDAPMSEFWAWSPRHRIGDDNRFFVKQPASAAHTYGRTVVAAEGFTTIGRHWQERVADNLKPAFDKACCEGLNRLVWHAFTCSPAEEGLPGQEYFAGTHFNPQSTWWSRSAPFLAYINRCQFLLQQGAFVADALYYYGDQAPNFAQRKGTDPAQVGAGRDYDVVSADALLARFAVREGQLVAQDGPAYRVLVLADVPGISPAVLHRIRDFVAAGATVIGSKPLHATGLSDYPSCDADVARIAEELWGPGPATNVDRRVGRGRVVSGVTAAAFLAGERVPPDVSWETPPGAKADLDFIHRRSGGSDIYFVAQREPAAVRIACTFRVADRRPELWNPVTGERRPATFRRTDDGRTRIELEFPPCGSWFVIFREPAAGASAPEQPAPALRPVQTLAGPWSVHFDPAWGAPAEIAFPALQDWTTHTNEGVRHYAGTATYQLRFELPAIAKPRQLDLGDVREIAEVRLNGRRLGVCWAPPFRVDLADAARAGTNELEVDVVNFWANRVIGDAALPPAERKTRTNIRRLSAQEPLMPSGLLGPVQLLAPVTR